MAAHNKPGICQSLIDAGADAGLLDPSAKDALGIALAAGVRDAASIIESAFRLVFTEPAAAHRRPLRRQRQSVP